MPATAGCLLITACGGNPTAAAPTNPAPAGTTQTPGSSTGTAATSTGSPAATTVAAPSVDHQTPTAANIAAPTTGGATQACSLITQQEAAAALGADPDLGRKPRSKEPPPRAPSSRASPRYSSP